MTDVAEIAKGLSDDHRKLLGRKTFIAYEGDWFSAFDLCDIGLATVEPGISRVGIHIAPTPLGRAVREHLQSPKGQGPTPSNKE